MIANIIILLWLGFLITVVVLMIRYLHSKNREQYLFQNFGYVDLPYITIDIQGHLLNMIVDSGAGASVISQGALDILNYEPCQRKINMGAMTDEYIPVDMVTIPLTINGKETKEDFILHPAQDFCSFKTHYGLVAHGLLGNDFLDKYNCVIDFKNHSVTFH